jgi:spore coat polysaccharide biosynthesis protein SpsF
VVVRLTADNVVPDGELVEELVAALPHDGYVRTASSLPYGLSAEAFRVHLLRSTAAEAGSAHDREHVTPLMRRRTADSEFTPPRLATMAPSDPVVRVRCTVDTLDDYVVAHAALARVEDPVAAPWHALLARWAEAGGTGPLPVPGARDNAIGQGAWVLGTVQLGLPYGAANQVGKPSGSQAGRLLSAAAAAGATHVDTARAYGESEPRIGRSLAQGLSERLGVVTKIKPLDDMDGVGSDGEAGLAGLATELSVEQSLRALGTSRVDALLVHRWADWHRGGGAVAETLDRLRHEGVASLVGASLSTPAELCEALADPRLGYVQMPFNLLDRRWLVPKVQEALAARPDVVVAVRSVFLQGLLAAPREARWPRNAEVDTHALALALESMARALGRESTADLALSYVRGHQFVTSVVLGADSVEQVEDQSRLVRRPPLSGAEIAEVHERIGGGSETLLDPSRWKMLP